MAVRTTLASLQTIIQQATAEGGKVDVAKVQKQAAADSFAFPEVAAEVAAMLGRASKGGHAIEAQDVADAFLTWLQQPGKAEMLGTGAKNPWLALRDAAKQAGRNLAQSFDQLYDAAHRYGLGYEPSLTHLSQEIAKGADFAWLAPFLALLSKRGKFSNPPTEEELVEALLDEALIAELEAALPAGPWAVFHAQAKALRMLKSFGESLEALGEEAGNGE